MPQGWRRIGHCGVLRRGHPEERGDFFVTYQTEVGVIRSERVENAAVAACAAFFAYMLARGVTEGIIDSNRGPTKADVGQ